ncbi:hypothetical protein [Fulvivirga lutea]|uniref:Uncharacterized protein n=1 Tax=Fulvivirga lutea TaxID=2810512 RepID=A0A974WDN3_9BACT|nr:hypothetical protein [Fulvivirga lutea]QSE95926.1 hypothetical protein JR347_09865 [Fulvivirga lutea]
MKKQLLFALPLTLICLIFYVSYTGDIISNLQHLFFLSITTFIVYAYQVSLNPGFKLLDKITWWLFILALPSIASILYWFRHINRKEED